MEIDFKALNQIFLVESEEQLLELEESLIALETRPSDEELLQSIFRVAHTIKGAASCCGLQVVTVFAHALEDALENLRDRLLPATGELITLLLQAVDALRHLISDAVAGLEEMPPAMAAMMKRLSSRTSQAGSDAIAGGARFDHLPERPLADSSANAARAKTLRVDLDKLDRLLSLSGEIIIAGSQFKQRLRQIESAQSAQLLEDYQQAADLYHDLQEMAMKIRMVPVGPVFRQYVRTVRDLAKAQDKMARLIVEGAEAEVDTSVIEHIRDPLNHMIRNAIDHGIELPSLRESQGKDPCGALALRAYHQAGNIIIQLEDDGAGLNRARILERARARGIISDGRELTDQEIHRLIFEPGFSTAEAVTDLSGRGVGMDVVRRNVEALRGSVDIESRDGQGSIVTLRLPLTLAVIDALIVGIGAETYAIPIDSIIECMELPRLKRGCGVINLRGDLLPYLSLRDLFCPLGKRSENERLIVVNHESGRAGIIVESIFGQSQIVIKPLGRLFKGARGVCGSTTLSNGQSALIVDVPGAIRKAVQGFAPAA
jgi:two-component system, chemotaxis family, sensor kinase CheA